MRVAICADELDDHGGIEVEFAVDECLDTLVRQQLLGRSEFGLPADGIEHVLLERLACRRGALLQPFMHIVGHVSDLNRGHARSVALDKRY